MTPLTGSQPCRAVRVGPRLSSCPQGRQPGTGGVPKWNATERDRRRRAVPQSALIPAVNWHYEPDRWHLASHSPDDHRHRIKGMVSRKAVAVHYGRDLRQPRLR